MTNIILIIVMPCNRITLNKLLPLKKKLILGFESLGSLI